MTWRWPVTLATPLPDGRDLLLRPLRRGDRQQWEDLRARNPDWLRPWEATAPGEVGTTTPFGRLRRGFDRAGRVGASLPLVIDVEGRLAGSVQIFDILWGSRRSAAAGYWLDREATGQGLATWSLALLVDHALTEAGLRRVEIGIRPDNPRSLAVVARLGLVEEGVRRDWMHVDGSWHDHRCFAVLAADLASDGPIPGGLVRRLRQEAAPAG